MRKEVEAKEINDDPTFYHNELGTISTDKTSEESEFLRVSQAT